MEPDFEFILRQKRSESGSPKLGQAFGQPHGQTGAQPCPLFSKKPDDSFGQPGQSAWEWRIEKTGVPSLPWKFQDDRG
jgi:hypothetical protein